MCGYYFTTVLPPLRVTDLDKELNAIKKRRQSASSDEESPRLRHKGSNIRGDGGSSDEVSDDEQGVQRSRMSGGQSGTSSGFGKGRRQCTCGEVCHVRIKMCPACGFNFKQSTQ
jgi:hypothetical protein